MNKNNYRLSPERKNSYINDIDPFITQQSIVATNLDIPLNTHNQMNDERNNNDTTIMRKVDSTLVHYQTDTNIKSKHNIKATSRLTCNDELSEYKHKYNVRKLLEEENNINQRSTNDKNHVEVENIEAYQTIKCHNTENQSDSYNPETNHTVSIVHNNIHNLSQSNKNSKRTYNNTGRNKPTVNIDNNTDQNKIGIKHSSKK